MLAKTSSTALAPAMAALDDPGAFLDAVLTASPAGVVCVDRDGRVESWNHAAEQLLGWTSEEAIGRPTAHVFAGPDGEVARAVVRALADLPPAPADAIVLRRDGGSSVVRVSAAPLPGEQEVPRGAVLVFVDVTGEHVANERLAYQGQLLANVREAIMAVDERLVITAWNHAAEDIYGWAAWEVIGRHVHDVLRTEFSGTDLAGVVRDLFEHGEFSGEVRQRSRSGKMLCVEVRAASVRDEHGKPAGFVMVNRDVTAGREAEEVRARLEAELRQSQKLEALGQLAAGVAHDFNNLLTAIQGFGELLVSRLEGSDLRRDAEEIVRTAERGAALTQQLLAFSRRDPVELAPLGVNELVLGLESLLRRTLAEPIDLRISLASALPVVLADAGQLEQVLLNLVVNARDAMPSGGTLTISTDTVWLDATSAARVNRELAPGRFVRLVVADTGLGMTAEVRERALEPFFTTKERGKGTGLGLATVWGIVAGAGGAVTLDSVEGAGTTVAVYLPALDAPSAAPILPEASNGSLGLPARRSILLVEDEDAVRALAARILEDHGYRVVVASDGCEALEAVAGGLEPDLLLTDLMLPTMTGGELARRVAERRPGVRILVMSGYAAREALEQAAEHTLILKPFRRDALLAHVRAALAST